MITSAFLTLAAITFVQIPLQSSVGGLPYLPRTIIQVSFSGLVQEGAKMVPLVIFWRLVKDINPQLGLLAGVVAGAGFGIFEAQWIHNMIFSSGFNWELVQTHGIIALLGFWERFFSIALHTAASGLAGYGLAKGWGWQFYLVASAIHAISNYGVPLVQGGQISTLSFELIFAAWVVAVTIVVMRIRWRKPTATISTPPEQMPECP